MGKEQDRYLDAAREFLTELESPNAYMLLGASRETPSSELLSAFMRAFRESSKSGRSPQVLAPAREQLKDTQKRLELDATLLDRDLWMREFETLRNQYALVDFLRDQRG